MKSPATQPLRESITAAEARTLMYADLSHDLAGNILLAAYCGIRSAATCGSRSICDDFGSCDPDDPAAVRRAIKQVAALLRKQGFSCTIQHTTLDIEWGE